ncbi:MULTISPECIES: triacylglycerol lipase [Pseudomonas]|uniref:Lipase n=1 Tax=Pseudomonas fluorescens (strain Q2-87) TaxID=1038922 RepID=J2EZH9_PSEFQ|nr:MULTISPECIES: triacylglycerol lipase [Pseudomonas]EJL02043.1 lipase [Pseudomonas fluorescens Q2-87]
MQRNATTQFPILLVPGLFGLETIGGFECFHGIRQALRTAGARVFIPYLSATHCNEALGEQLLAQIDRVLNGTGATKVNLIGHSQGALAARYAGAHIPGKVASVTSVSGPNQGSELADFLRKALVPGRLPGPVASKVATLFVDFIALLTGQTQLPTSTVAALAALTTEGVGTFNDKYPQGLPKNWGESGPDKVNGVRYYSWSGTLQDAPGAAGDVTDPLRLFCRAFAEYFITEAGQNDGMVGRFSSHLGKVIRSDYPMDHMDAIHQPVGKIRKGADPIALYVRHAERLRKAGL